VIGGAAFCGFGVNPSKISKAFPMNKSICAAVVVAASLGCAAAVLAPAFAAAASPNIVAVTPVNGDRSDTPITAVGLTFSGPVQLQSLSVTGPAGAQSSEQVLVGDGDKVAIAATYSYPLPTPAAGPGTYSVGYMAWAAKSRTSLSGSYTFKVGTAEEVDAADEAAAAAKAEADAKAQQDAEAAEAAKPAEEPAQ